ncbi:hypothetical protein KPL74_08935 [Bacillus sp. NP157]|nr:hypothetical protein KPL74_08935 [Bacillus sp. NP157]
MTAPVIAVYTYGRIAGGSADDYRASGKALQAGHVLSSGVTDAWLVTVRENEKTAQETGEDALLTGVARRLYSREGH